MQENKNISALLETGEIVSLEEYQRTRSLPVGSDKMGVFFSLREKRFSKDIELFGGLVICCPLMRLMDEYRSLLGKPVSINSFNRTEEYQEELRRRGFKAAKNSPHVVKMAADINTHSKKQTEEGVLVLRKAAKKLGIKCRIGWRQYMNAGSTFIHVDVCPMYYAPGKPFHGNDHPKVWEIETEW